MIVVLARLRVKSGSESEFVQVARKLAELSCAEEGSRGYELLREGEKCYSFLERYVDTEAVEMHRKSEHYRTLGRQLGEFMEGKPEVIRLETVD